ncbi:MAG: energy-coupling factor transporter ATPase [Ureaplasma sp.]|nr:energy-coupling factor transporter ATPase [Ureaplasma sp.]
MVIIMKKIAVEFKNVNFSYVPGIPVLNNVSFQIYENEYVCVIGHNGSGKSTISKVLTGLLKPSSGSVEVFGLEINLDNIKKIRDNVGIVFQNPDNQFVGMTAEDDIAFGLENRRVPREEMQDIINTAAKIAGVSNLLKKEPSQLSGGQKQRVAISSVLAINPKVMIFDESTSMLDPKGKEELKSLILDLRHKANKTIISITHDMEEVIKADKVIVMEKGVVVEVGAPSEIFIDEEKMEKLKLDFPYTLKLSSLLSKEIKDIKPTLNKEELIEQICQAIK